MAIRNLAAALCLLLLLAASTVFARTAAVKKIPLHAGWRFRQAGKAEWRPATVPGCVHTDLLDNRLIEDPFYRDNEPKLHWIGKTDWEYQLSFTVATGRLTTAGPSPPGQASTTSAAGRPCTSTPAASSTTCS